MKCRPIPVVPSDEETQTSGGAYVCSSWQDSLVCNYVKKGLKKHKRDAKSQDPTCGVAQVKEVNNGRSEVFSRWAD